jgi:glycosyltransferase involved in cell wall biosynthesis
VSEIRRIVMLGTAPETRGGISAVIEAWRAEGLFERWPVDYVATHCDGGAGQKLLAAARGLRRFVALLAAHRRVLVHVHCASHASFWRKCVFMAIAHAARCPVILHLHGGGFAHFYENECGPLGRRVVRHFLERAACVVAVSERWRAWLVHASANPNIVCIPNPVRAEIGPARRGRRNVVLFLGRIEAAKGIPELIEALSGLRADVPDAELVCAGAGEVEAAAGQAERLGIGDAVRFPGWLGEAEKRAWLRRAGVFVLPSHAEGLPMGLLEAMAAGLPVVASAVGGIPDVVKDGVNGLLVAPGDAAALERALRRLLRDPRLAAALGAAGRESVREHHACERVVAQLGQVYAGLGVAGVARHTSRVDALRKVA